MKRKHKILFIINPVSGNKKRTRLKMMIRAHLNQEKYDSKIEFTKYSGHASELAEVYIQKQYEVIIAVGGDGTINEVARKLIGTGVVFGIVPNGSGNGLARHLKIPLNVKKSIELINKLDIEKIDCGMMNHQPFFCTCGIGFDAKIGKKFAEATKRGFQTYFKTTLREFFSYKPQKYVIEAEGKRIKVKAFLVTIANASQYGNNAYIAPQADIQDGLLDISILKPFPKHKILGLGIKLFFKRVHFSNYVQTFKASDIVLKRKKKGAVHYDGEPAKMSKTIKIHVLPGQLNVIVP